MADFRYKMLAAESVMFFSIQIIALFVGAAFIRQGPVEQLPVKEALPSFFIAFLIAIGLMVALLYFLKTPRSFSIFFAFLIFIGTEIVFESFLPALIAIIAAIGIVAARFVWPNVLTHNLAMFLTVAGISAQLGLMLPVLAVIIILAALSIYDYIAVFKTKSMIKMFRQMLARGAPFAIVIPESVEHFGARIEKVSREKLQQQKKPAKPKFLMLGTGDLAFPAVFAVSVLVNSGIWTSLSVVFGALLGIVVNHYFLTQRFRAIPALPAIAVCSILAYGITQIPSLL